MNDTQTATTTAPLFEVGQRVRLARPETGIVTQGKFYAPTAAWNQTARPEAIVKRVTQLHRGGVIVTPDVQIVTVTPADDKDFGDWTFLNDALCPA